MKNVYQRIACRVYCILNTYPFTSSDNKLGFSPSITQLLFLRREILFSHFVFPVLFLLISIAQLHAQTNLGMINDLYPGTGSSGPNSLTKLGSVVIFAAGDGANGTELWRTDGTATGTYMVKDIYPGNNSGGNPNSGSPSSFVLMGSYVYFTANNGSTGRELWRTDGTANGTTLIKDINTNPSTTSGVNLTSAIGELTAIDNKLYFRADDGVNGMEPWISDGTAGGTMMLKNIAAGNWASSTNSTKDAVNLPNEYCTTCGGTFEFVKFGSYIYFNANTQSSQYSYGGLWRTDGTPAGTVSFGAGGYAPNNLFNAGTFLFFFAGSSNRGNEPYVSDGTVAGTVMLKDISTNANTESNYSNVQLPKALMNGILYFTAKPQFDNTYFSHNNELWRTDGTNAGTYQVKDITPSNVDIMPGPDNVAFGQGDSDPRDFLVYNNKLYFTANNWVNGRELWVSDGTDAGTVMVKDINTNVNTEAGPTVGNAFGNGTTPMYIHNGLIYFAATTGANATGIELWRTDGTAANTVPVKDINPGFNTTGSMSALSSSPNNFVSLDANHLLFRATTAEAGSELFILGGNVVTVTTSANGTVSPPGSISTSKTIDIGVKSGSSPTFTFAPTSGNSVQSVVVNGSSVGAPTSRAFSNVTTNQTLQVTFGSGPPVGSITTGAISGGTWCNGSAVNVQVPYTITGTFNSGNVFTAVLSNSSGSFSSGTTNIGTATTTAGGNISATIPAGLTAGTAYRIRVVSNNPIVTGSDNGTNLTINSSPTITAGAVTQPATCSGTGSIAFTSTNLSNGTYSLSFTPTGTGATTSPKNVTVSGNAFTLSALTAGSYSNFSLTNNGCTATNSPSKTITAPAGPTITAGAITQPTTCGGNGSIAFTSTNLSNGSYSISFTASGTGATASPQTITVSNNAFSLAGLKAGMYSNFSITANGCTASTSTSKTLSDPVSPTLTVGTSTNPTTCSGNNGSIAFTTTNLTNGTYTLNYSKNSAATTASVTVSNNVFTLSGLSAGTYTPFSITNANNCTATASTSKVLTNPPSPTLTAGTVTQPTVCGGTGSIAFTTTNVSNGSYTLTYSKNSISTTTSVTITSGAFSLTGLTAGTYTPFSITANNCPATTSTSKVVNNPSAPTLTAGTLSNPTTCGGTNGSIPFTTALIAGSYTLNYTKNGSSVTANITVASGAFTLINLSAGTYAGFSITNNGCTSSASGTRALTDPATPTLTAGTSVNPTTCGGTNGSIPFTTNLTAGTYTLNYTKNGTGATASITVASGAFTLAGLSAGTYTAFSVTNNGCIGSASTTKLLSDPTPATLTPGTAVSPTVCSGNDGRIPFTTTLSAGSYTLNYTKNGNPATAAVTVASSAFNLNNLSAGVYTAFSITPANGCTATNNTSKTVADPASPTLTAGAVTNPSTCGGTGSIAFTTTGLTNGSYSISYTGTGSPKTVTVTNNAFSLTGLSAGNYSNFSVTRTGCTGTDAASKTISNPTAPILTAGAVTNPATCGGTGSIAFTTDLANGTYTLNYNRNGSPTSKSISVSGGAFSLSGTGITAGTYTAFSITTNGCTGSTASSKVLTDPTGPTLSAGTVTNPTTCGGNDGSIAFTTNLADGTYSLTYTGAGSPKSITVAGGAFNLANLTSGAYSNFSIINNGCTGTELASKSLSDPAAPTLTAGATINPSGCSMSDGSIAFTTTNIADGNYTLTYVGAGSPKTVTVNSNAFILAGLPDGTFSNFSITNTGGCTGSLSSSVTLSDLALPVLVVGVATDPNACNVANGSIAFTSANLPDGGYSLSFTSTGTTGPKDIVVAGGAFTLSGLSAGTYSNFSVTRSGCTGNTSASRTLNNPPTPTLTAGAITNTSTCDGTDGSIDFTTTNLADNTYSLSFTGTGSPQNVTISNNAFTLANLSAGTYSNFSITQAGCIGTEPVTKTVNDPPTISITAGLTTQPTACANDDGSIAFSSINLPDGNYTLTYTGAGSPKTVTVAGNAFTLNGLQAGAYSNFSITYLNCTATDVTSKSLTDPAAPTLTAGTVTNPTTCNGTNGSIAFTTSLPNGTYTLNYTGSGSPQSINVVNGAFVLGNLGSGIYSGFSITNNGCTGTDAASKTLSDPAAPTLTAGTVTNPTTCNGTNGSIAFTTSLADGTYTLNYTGSGSPKSINVVNGAFVLGNLPDGIYADFSIISGGCTGSDATSKTLVDPTAPTLTAGAVTNPTVCNATDGSIAFTTSLANGTYTLNYSGLGSPQSISVTNGAFTLENLHSGIYSDFSITTNGCIGSDITTKSLTDPAAPTLTAGTVTNPTTCNGTNGSISFTTSLPNGTYTLNYTGAGSPQSINVLNGAFVLGNLGSGIYSGFSITNNGCTGTDAASKTLSDPAAPTLTAGTATNPTTCNGTNGSIAFTTSLADGTYTLNYTGSGSPKSINVVNGAFVLGNLPDGIYADFSIISGGCTGSDATSKTLVDPAAPTLTAGVTTNPTTCSGTDGSIAFTTSLANGTYTLNYSGTGSPQSITVTNGAFVLGNLGSGTYSGFSITNNGCTGTDATSKTLSDPAAPTLTAGAITNPTTCNGNEGSIAFTTANLPDGIYTLNYTGPGSSQNVTITTGSFTLTGLSAGAYSGFSITDNGCTATAPATLTLSDPTAPTLTAGVVTNQSICGGTDGSIAFTTTQLPNGNYSLTYTGAGSPKTVTIAGNAFSLNGLSEGSYSDFSITWMGCTATDTTTKTLNSLVSPAPPTASVTMQPTCVTPTGVIVISNPISNDFEYSINGSDYQSSRTFNGVAPGNYNVTFKNTLTGCVSQGLALVINPAPVTTISASISGDATVCKNASAGVTFIGSGGTAPYTFTYTINGGTGQTVTTVSGSSIILPASTSVGGTFTYALVSVQGANPNQCGQLQSDSVAITVLAPAIPVIVEDTVFLNGPTTLTAQGCSGAGFTLLWYKSADNSPVTMPVSPSEATSYYAKCQQTANAVACVSDRSVDVTILLVQRIFVNAANVNLTQDGTTWASSFASLQTALNTAAASVYPLVEVWVAQGTYTPGTLRKDAFEIPTNVKVYGGFVGTESQISQRNWKTHPTILSGEIGTSALNDNSHHVVLFRATNAATQLDGFTIQRGYAEFYAGNQNSDLNDPNLLSSGGGILAIDKSKGLITNCTLTDNRATSGGAIMLMDSSQLMITKTIVWGNEANFGGGIYMIGGSKPRLENVLIVTNKGLGGGVYINQSQPTLVNCTIASNQGNGSAGGIFNVNSITTVKNSILWGNTSPQSTQESVITYSIVEGGYAGTGNSSQNPLFVNAGSSGLAPMGGLGDYNVQPCSPAINAGTNADAPLVDLDGNARPYPSGIGITDMGVYESKTTGNTGPDQLTVNEPITEGTVLKTGGQITATNRVSNATVVYQATRSVTLSPGFSAVGNTFQAVIGGCGTN